MEKVRLPLGRIVSGVPYGTDKDYETQQLLRDDEGKPYILYRFKVAIPKGTERDWKDTDWGRIFTAVAENDVFRVIPVDDPIKNVIIRDFMWKVEDGDSETEFDGGGNRLCDKPGFKGHWVILVSGKNRVPMYAEFVDGAATALAAEDVMQIKETLSNAISGKIATIPENILNRTIVAGDYVYVTLGVGAHRGKKPGMTLLPNVLVLNNKGIPLINKVKEDLSVYKQAPAIGIAQTQGAPVATLNKQFVDGPKTVVPPPSVIPPPKPTIQEYVMTEKANGATEAQYIAAGWTRAQLLEHGLMADVSF